MKIFRYLLYLLQATLLVASCIINGEEQVYDDLPGEWSEMIAALESGCFDMSKTEVFEKFKAACLAHNPALAKSLFQNVSGKLDTTQKFVYNFIVQLQSDSTSTEMQSFMNELLPVLKFGFFSERRGHTPYPIKGLLTDNHVAAMEVGLNAGLIKDETQTETCEVVGIQLFKANLIKRILTNYQMSSDKDMIQVMVDSMAAEIDSLYANVNKVKVFGLLIGDGMIKSEIDLDGKNIEGTSSLAAQSFLHHQIQKCISDNRKQLLTRRQASKQLVRFQQKLSLRLGMCLEMFKLKDSANKYEAFEEMALVLLRFLPFNESILFGTNHSTHAMAMEFKRTGHHFQVLFINTGDGQNAYHDSVQMGEDRERYLPLRFEKVALHHLVKSKFFRFMAEMLFMTELQEQRGYEITSEHIYDILLASLLPFQIPYEQPELETYGVIPSQRSGTCAIRSVIATLALNLKSDFRWIKLILFKNVISDLKNSLENNEIAPLQRPVAERLLKFAYENHARSILRFRKYNNTDLNLDLSQFGDEAFWNGYENVKEIWSLATEDKFDVAHFSEQTSKSITEDYKKVFEATQLVFESSAQKSDTAATSGSDKCSDYSQIVFAPFERKKFTFYLGALRDCVSTCLSEYDAIDRLGFLVSHILYHIPDVDDWDYSVPLPDDSLPEMYAILHALYKAYDGIAPKNDISSQNWSDSVYASVIKLTGILYHFASVQMPVLKSLKIISKITDEGSDVLYKCGNTTATMIVEKLKSDLADKSKPLWIEDRESKHLTPTFKPCAELAKVLVEMTTHSVNLRDYKGISIATLPTVLTAKRISYKIPKIFYYLRDFSIIASGLYTENQYFSTLATEKGVPDPCSDCIINPVNGLEVPITYDYLNLNYADCYSIGNDDPVWMSKKNPNNIYREGNYFRSYGSEKIYLTNIDEMQVLLNVFADEHDRLARYAQLISVKWNELTWPSIVYHGYRLLNNETVDIEKAGVSFNILFNTAERIIESLQSGMVANEVLSPIWEQNSVQLNGLVAVLGQFITYLPENLGRLRYIQDQEYELLTSSLPLNFSTRIMTSYAYLLSFASRYDLTSEESAKIIEIYSIYYNGRTKISRTIDVAHLRLNAELPLTRALCHVSKEQLQSCVQKMTDPTFEFGSLAYPLVTGKVQDVKSTFDLVNGSFTVGEESTKAVSLDTGYEKLRMFGISQKDVKLSSVLHTQIDSENFSYICHLDAALPWTLQSHINIKTISITIKGKDKVFAKLESTTGMMMALSKLLEPVQSMPLPGGNQYSVAILKAGPICFLSGGKCVAWANNTTMSFAEDYLPVMQYISAPEILASPLTRPDGLALFEKGEEQYLLFKNYKISDDANLWLVKRKDGEWSLLSDEKYKVPSKQAISGLSGLPTYLLVKSVQNGEVRSRVIVPIEHFAIDRTLATAPEVDVDRRIHGLKFDRTFEHQVKNIFIVSSDSEGNPSSSNRAEALLLAYHFLVSRNYSKSFRMLRRCHQMMAFSDQELMFLAWIAREPIDMHDGSPEAAAIQCFAIYLVFNNNMLFKNYKIIKQSPGYPFPMPYNFGLAKRYWEGAQTSQEFTKSVNRYLLLRNKVSKSLRFDSKSKLGIVSPYEEEKWLDALWQYGQRENYDYQGFLTGNLKNETAELIKLLPGNCNGRLYENVLIGADTFDLGKLKFFEPDELKVENRWKIFFELLFSPPSEQIQAQLRTLYLTFGNTAYADIITAYYAATVATQAQVKGILDIVKSSCSSWSYSEECGKKLLKAKKRLVESVSLGLKRQRRGPKKFKTSKKAPLLQVKKAEFCLAPLTSNEFSDLISGNVTCSLKFLLDQIIVFQYSGKTNFGLFLKDMVCDHFKYVDLQSGTSKDFIELLHHKMDGHANELYREMNSMVMGQNGPQDLLRLKEIGKGGRIYSELEFVHAFAQADCMKYHSKFPDLPAADTQRLHDLTAQWILAKTNCVDLQRLEKAMKAKSDLSEFYIRRSSTKDTAFMAYEYFMKSRLSVQQIQDLNTMLEKDAEGNYKNMVLERLMSSGKTFILGTLLTFMKADGKNLPILVLPEALYESGSSDMVQRTLMAFDADGFSFNFGRSGLHINMRSLKWIHQKLKWTIAHKGYLVLTPTVLQSMHNGLVELGKRAPLNIFGLTAKLENDEIDMEDFEDLSKNPLGFTPLRKVLKIFKEKGLALFDEIDMVFDPTHELNYPINKGNNPDTVTKLRKYGLVMCEFARIIMEKLTSPRFDLNSPILEAQFTQLKPILVKAIIKHLRRRTLFQLEAVDDSELASIDTKLVKTFISVADSDPKYNGIKQDILRKISFDSYEILSILRLCLNEWLFASWHQNVNEHYGYGNRPFAIPFAHASAPKLGSSFADRWLTYFKTIRMWLVMPLPAEMFVEATTWLKQALVEESKIQDLKEYPMKNLFSELFDAKPGEVDLEYEPSVTKYHGVVKGKFGTAAYRRFVFGWLYSKVIPDLPFFLDQYSANGIDTSKMVKCVQGYSGTIPAPKILPPAVLGYLDLDKTITWKIESALMTHNNLPLITVEDNLVAEKLLESKEIQNSIKSIGGPLTALIDIGAYFKNESNKDVALAIEKVLKPEAVIFYDDNQVTIRANGIDKTLQGTSRTVIDEQGIATDKRITFYDQKHTTGADIHQDLKGYALVTVGLGTTSRDFYQGIMRMRKFLENQRILILVPQNMVGEMKNVGGNYDLSGLMNYLDFNLKEKNKRQNVVALNHVFRSHFKEDQYDTLLSGNRNCISDELWIKFTDKSLEVLMLQTESIEIFKYFMWQINSYASAASIFKSKDEMGKIKILKTEAINYLVSSLSDAESYQETMTISKSNEFEQTVEEEAEEDQDNLRINQVQNQNIQETNLVSNILGKSEVPCNFDQDEFPEVESYDLAHVNSDSSKGKLVSLNKLFTENGNLRLASGLFMNHIYVSRQFIEYIFGPRRKYIFNVLILQDGASNKHLRAVIVTGDEARSIQKIFASGKCTIFRMKAWLYSPLGTLMAKCESHPELPDTKALQAALTQVLIYGGYTDIDCTSFYKEYFKRWISEDPVKRSSLFVNLILGGEEGVKFFNGQYGKLLTRERALLDEIEQSHEFILLMFLSKSLNRVREHLRSLRSKDKFDAVKIIEIGEMESAVPLDNKGVIATDVIRALLMYIVHLKKEHPTGMIPLSDQSNLQRAAAMIRSIVHGKATFKLAQSFKVISVFIRHEPVDWEYGFAFEVFSAIMENFKHRSSDNLLYWFGIYKLENYGWQLPEPQESMLRSIRDWLLKNDIAHVDFKLFLSFFRLFYFKETVDMSPLRDAILGEDDKIDQLIAASILESPSSFPEEFFTPLIASKTSPQYMSDLLEHAFIVYGAWKMNSGNYSKIDMDSRVSLFTNMTVCGLEFSRIIRPRSKKRDFVLRVLEFGRMEQWELEGCPSRITRSANENRARTVIQWVMDMYGVKDDGFREQLAAMLSVPQEKLDLPATANYVEEHLIL